MIFAKLLVFALERLQAQFPGKLKKSIAEHLLQGESKALGNAAVEKNHSGVKRKGDPGHNGIPSGKEKLCFILCSLLTMVL